MAKGGGGGGVLIYAHDSIPHLPGGNQITYTQGEMEFCNTVLFPNYDYAQPLQIVGVYRPPKSQHPPYKEALEKILRKYQKEGTTTIIAGGLNIDSWAREYHEWVESEELGVLAGRRRATHRSGTADDTVLIAVGDYVPEGILPGETETE